MSAPASAEGIERSKAFLRTYALLIRAAERRELVHYADIARILGLPAKGSHTGKMTGELLGAIVEQEISSGRPMLSAVAVSSVNNRPGKGFYGLAEQHGLVAPDISNEEQRAFWHAELERVYQEWEESAPCPDESNA